MASIDKDFKVKNGLIVGDSTNLVNYSSASPSNPFVGQLWISASSLYAWSSASTWVLIGDGNSGGGGGSASGTPLNIPNTLVSRSASGIFSIGAIDLDLSGTVPLGVGRFQWNSSFGTPEVGLIGGNVTAHIGQHVHAYVTNAEGSPLVKGDVVYLFGASGDRASVKKAINTADPTSAKTLGVVAEAITTGGQGFVTVFGVVDKLNLSAYSPGDTLWLSASAGKFTSVKPSAPNHTVFIGVVERANAGNGQLFVNVQNGYELGELHDVLINGIADNHIISYNQSASLWLNQNLATAIQEVDGSGSGIDADLLDGQHGSFYLDWFNITSKPNTILGVELTGNTNGSGSVTLSQLNNGQVSITTATNFAAHSSTASSINWSGVTDIPDPIIGVSLSGNTVGAASVTLNNLTNGQIQLVTRTEFAQTASSIAISGVVNLQHQLNSSASAIGQRLTIENASATYRPLSAAVDADTLDGFNSSYFINSSSAVQEKLGTITFHDTVNIKNLVITGSAVTLSTTNLALTDSLIQLAHEQYTTDAVDIGIIGSYGDGTTSSAGHYHASFARDASQNKWKLLENGPPPVDNVIDYSSPSVVFGTLQLGTIEVSSSVTVTNLNADLLDNQQGSYYLDWSNTTNKPDPVIGVSLTGNTTGAASATLTDLANGQISIVTNTSFSTSASSINWDGVTNKPDPIIGINLTGIVTGAASATLTDLQNGQISITTAMNIITNAQSGTSYSLVLSDAGDLVELNNASPITLVIPLNSTQAFPTGTKIDILQTGAGQVTASYVSGVTLNSSGGATKLVGQWSAATLIKRGTDTWVAIGDLTV